MPLLTVAYSSLCLECGELVPKGSRVFWQRGDSGVRHVQCSEEGRRSLEAITQSQTISVGADFDIPRPEGLEYLPFQKAGIAYAGQRMATLNADQPGLGKTIQAIGLINLLPDIKTVLLTCPASLMRNWENELDKWLVRNIDINIYSYEELKKVTKKGTFDLLVVDEAQAFKNPGSKRTGLLKEIAKRCNRKLFLTGTPLENGRPIELWPLLQMLVPEVFDPPGTYKKKAVPIGENGGLERYQKRYCGPRKVYYGKNLFHWDFNGASNLEELQERLRSTCMVRRLKRDVLKELPAKRRQLVPLGEAATRIELPDDYDSAFALLTDEREYLKNVRTLKGKKVAFEDISRIRREEAIAKVPKALAFLKDSLGNPETAEKVVVFAHHQEVIEALRIGLKEYGPLVLTGDTPVPLRQGIVDRFQEKPGHKVIICALKAAGVGLTLTAASRVVFVELDWTPGGVSQAEDRVHRIGQKGYVLIQHLVVDGTIDAKMAKMIVRKQEMIDKALDRAV